MKIVVAPKAGFCFGVKRALETLKHVRSTEDGPVATLGPLIHNPRVVEDLQRNGVRVVQSPEEASSGVLVIRSHGETPDQIERALNAGLRVVDATCPCLKEAQRKAVELCDAGYDVILLGERDHAEVRATVGMTGGRARVIESASEIEGLTLGHRVALLSQTTRTFESFRSAAIALIDRVRELTVVNTICPATSQRQEAAAEIARHVDVMIVVGGRNSANTTRLAEVCRAVGVVTHHIEDASELQAEWFHGVNTAGLTAGASTPQGHIEEVVRRMTELENPAGHEQSGHDGQAEMADHEEYGGTVRSLEEGEVIPARVVHVTDDMAFVDVGTKSELGIPLSELTTKDVRSAREVVSVGDEINVLVVRSGDEDKILLSARKAEQEQNWIKVEEAHENGTAMEGKVKEVVKGGLIVDIGLAVRAFVPASQIARGFVEDLAGFVGQTLAFRIIEFDRYKRRVVLSRRVLLDEEYQKAKKSVYADIQPGSIKEGTVTRLADFGAFVDLGGGVEGLLHISEISWDRIHHPSERLQVGMPLRVEVTKVDAERERISLSLRSLTPHPWAAAAGKFEDGQVVSGEVTRLAPFGAFVKVADGVEGLVHISELSDHRIAKPEEAVQPGQKVSVKILKVDAEARRLSLSIAQAMQDAESQEYQKYMVSDAGPVTIGDVLNGKAKAAGKDE